MPTFTFGPRVVMSPDTFEALPVVAGRPEAVRANVVCKALISQPGDKRERWHAVRMWHAFGVPVYNAGPITIRLYAAEAD